MKPWLKWTFRIFGGLAALFILFIVGMMIYVNSSWDRPYDRPVIEMKAPTDRATLARGKYLYTYTLTCWECHSTEREAMKSPSGGREFDLTRTGPGFGYFYSRNITPDMETGIGGWTDGEVVRAIREGLSRDGRALFPIMPMEALQGLSDEDALAIVAYLRTLEPVYNEVPEDNPSFTAKALLTFGMIKPNPPISAAITTPARSATTEYGKYLANNASLCMDCHTPRNLADGSFYRDSLFSGSTIAFGEDEQADLQAYARNITPDRETGIGGWTEDQFFDAVRSGMRPDSTVLAAHMPYSYFGLMDDEDLRAMFLYLQTVPALKRTTPPVYRSELYLNGSGIARGEVIFKNTCMVCHGEEGKGATPTSTALAEIAPTINDRDIKQFIMGGAIGLRMPSFGKTLTSEQIDDIIAYIRSWQEKPPMQ